MKSFTDLHNECKAHKPHILHIYEHILKDVRDRVKSVCEIGVWNGESLNLWLAYFPNIEKVVGIDTQIRNRNHDFRKVTLIQGDVMTQGVIDQIKELGPYDIVIDDASHMAAQYVPTYHNLIDQAKLLYIIEDIAAFVKSGGVELGKLVETLAINIQDEKSEPGHTCEETKADIQCVTIYKSLLVVEKRWRWS